ncbi:PRC-barrel domain-containing protein [Methanobacterium sp.]|uniref:PRC-barrel domain-containing protein n=1 Tax=Methanobacterium sp. TaxID=2164 RepID=UPI003C77C6B5
MKIDEIKGKEVIDDKGNVLGEVEDIDLNFRNRRIEGIVLRAGGLTGKIGRGETKVIPCNMIDAIGEKVLLKAKPLTQEDLDVITGGE